METVEWCFCIALAAIVHPRIFCSHTSLECKKNFFATVKAYSRGVLTYVSMFFPFALVAIAWERTWFHEKIAKGFWK
jgi:hypothetical protein